MGSLMRDGAPANGVWEEMACDKVNCQFQIEFSRTSA
jgi:hypothetical protein